MLPAAVGRSSSETPCSPMKVAIVTTIAGRRSEVISRPCNKPKPAVSRRIRMSPPANGPARNAVGRQERGEHDAKPGQRADRQIDGADQHRRQLRARQKRQDAEERQHALDAERRQEVAVHRLRTAENDEGENGQHQSRKMIAGGKLAPAPIRRAGGRLAGARHRRGEIGLGDGGVGDRRAGQFVDDAAAGEDQHPVAKTFELDAVGRRDQHRRRPGRRPRAAADRFRCARRYRRPWSARRPGAPSAWPRFRGRTAPFADCRRTIR